MPPEPQSFKDPDLQAEYLEINEHPQIDNIAEEPEPEAFNEPVFQDFDIDDLRIDTVAVEVAAERSPEPETSSMNQIFNWSI